MNHTIEVRDALEGLLGACEALLADPDWKKDSRLSVGGEWSDGDKEVMLNAMLKADAALAGHEQHIEGVAI